MLKYIVQRVLLMVPLFFLISLLIFIVIELPPGDYVDLLVIDLVSSGQPVSPEEEAELRAQFGLDKPFPLRYIRWISDIVLHGDFKMSLLLRKPVSELIVARVPITVAISLPAVLLSWVIAITVGLYSATHQYKLPDYIITFLAFIGRGMPAFLLALILIWVAYSWLGWDIGGLVSREFEQAPWSWAKIVNLIQHLTIPVLVVAFSGSVGLLRVVRANMLDELHKPYVVTARAKGLTERRLTLKYPARVALNPFFSNIGSVLPGMVGGFGIVAIIISLPTVGPLMLRALLNHDMYLAGGFLLMLSVLTQVGTLISDILLALVDPRIRMGAR